MGRTSDAREKILQSGRELFHANGYNSIGVKEICDRAGVRKGSFYHFFPSKVELVLAILDEHERLMGMRTVKALDPALPPLDRIRAFFSMIHQGCLNSKESCDRVLGCPVGNLAIELSTQEEAVSRRISVMFDRLAGLFEEPIREAMENGALPPSDPKSAARSLVAYFQGLTLLTKVRNEPALMDDLAEGAIRLLGGAGKAGEMGIPAEAGISR